MGEFSLGRPKGDHGRLIGGLISHSFLHLFRDFDCWSLKRGWLLNGGQLYWQKNYSKQVTER